MEVKNLPLKDILGEEAGKFNFYKIPPYQRAYSWGSEEWDNLLKDLNENERDYFLGTIICVKNNDNIQEIIDGQQRLTTLSILLNAILYTINQNYSSKISLDKTYKKYRKMFDTLEDILYLDKIKLELSIQKNNKEDYEYLLSINNFIEKEEPNYFKSRKISKAFEFFKKNLLEDEDFNDIDKLFEFLEKVLYSNLIKIEVDNYSSAFVLFESVNNRGKPLSPVDLIKNYMIQHHNNEDKNEVNEKWQIIIDNIPEYKDQVRFLRQYYHAFKKECDKKLTHNYQKATQRNIINIYEELIKKDANFILKDLIEKSKIYSLFINPQNYQNQKFEEYKDKFKELLELGIAPAYSVLLYLCIKYENENLKDILEIIEKWFVRRSFTQFPATGRLDQIFLDLILEFDEKGFSIELLKEFLTSKNKYKNDEELKRLLLEDNIYELNAKSTKYILVMLEKLKRDRESGENIDFWEKNKWSVEHILPQTPKNNSKWKEIFTDEDRKQFTHKIGNLTLSAYNSKLSNSEFETKAAYENGGLGSGKVQINSYIKDNNIQEWTKNDIEKRGEKLVEELMPLLTI